MEGLVADFAPDGLIDVVAVRQPVMIVVRIQMVMKTTNR